MPLSKTLGDTIARAIRDADTSYFFESYSKQADAVLEAIDAAGFTLVHKKANKDMVRAGVETLTLGVHNKAELTRMLYAKMIEISHKQHK